MSKLTNFWLGTALTLVLAAPALADTAAAPKPTADTVVATVNGTKITLGNLIVLRSQLPAQYQQLPDDVLFKAILDQIVQQELLAQVAEKNLTKENQLALDNDRRAYLAGSVLDGVGKAAVTDAAIKAAYDAKYANAKPGTEYHAAHILVATEQEAKDLKAKIDAGGDFAALAKANSKDGSAANGGDLGWFGVGMMVKPFEDAVVAMKPGTVSDPVQTQFGWHLIKLEETRPAKAPDLDSVKDDLSKEIEQKAIAEKIDELTKSGKVEKSDAGIDPATLRDQTLLGN